MPLRTAPRCGRWRRRCWRWRPRSRCRRPTRSCSTRARPTSWRGWGRSRRVRSRPSGSWRRARWSWPRRWATPRGPGWPAGGGPHGGGAGVRWVPPGGNRQALAALPLQALGLGVAVCERLAGLGVVDAGGLARLPEGTLAHRFGPEGVLAVRLARGEDTSRLVPYAPETLPEEGAELEAPADGAEPLLFVLKRLADR